MKVSFSAANQAYYPELSRAKAVQSNNYENPINRNTEKGLTILSNVGMSALGGATAAGLASCFVEGGFKAHKKLLGAVGALVTAAISALTLPAALYNTKVSAFAREKEMDVFSRDRALKSNIMEEVDKEVQNENVDLDKKISHYTSLQMANNGNGMLIKGA